jgi:hypothetical protein
MPSVLALDRKAIRDRFEERFSATRMAADYVKLYQRMLRKRVAPERRLASMAEYPIASAHPHSDAAMQTEPN